MESTISWRPTNRLNSPPTTLTIYNDSAPLPISTGSKRSIFKGTAASRATGTVPRPLPSSTRPRTTCRVWAKAWPISLFLDKTKTTRLIGISICTKTKYVLLCKKTATKMNSTSIMILHPIISPQSIKVQTIKGLCTSSPNLIPPWARTPSTKPPTWVPTSISRTSNKSPALKKKRRRSSRAWARPPTRKGRNSMSARKAVGDVFWKRPWTYTKVCVSRCSRTSATSLIVKKCAKLTSDKINWSESMTIISVAFLRRRQ